MKKRKGFTLVELLAVIVIIAIVAVIAIVSTLTIKEKIQKRMLRETLASLVSSAETYGTDNKETLDEATNERTIEGLKRKYITVTVGELLSAKYYSSETKDNDGNPSINYYKDNSSINGMEILVYQSNSSGRVDACIPGDDWGFDGNIDYIRDPLKEEFGEDGIYCTEKSAVGGQSVISLSITNEDDWTTSKTLTIAVTNESARVAGYKIVNDKNDCKNLEPSTWSSFETEYVATKTYTDEYGESGQTYVVCVKDEYENLNNKLFTIKKIDIYPPEITLLTSLEDGYVPSKNNWAKEKSITAKLIDTSSGVVGYKLANNATDCASASGYMASSNGNKTIKFNTNIGENNDQKYICVKDAVGNYTNTPIKVQKIDTTKPVIELSTTQQGTINNNYTQVTATVTSTPASGIKGYKFSTTSGSYGATVSTNNVSNIYGASGYIYAKAISNAGVESDEVAVAVPKTYYEIGYEDNGGTYSSGYSKYGSNTYPIKDYYYSTTYKYQINYRGSSYIIYNYSPRIRLATRTGFVFGGYYTENNCGGTKFLDESGYLAANQYTNYFTSDSKIYACWKYRITFDGNSGSPSPQSIDYLPNSTYGTMPTPTRTNYNFVGWYTSRTSGTKVDPTNTVTSTRTLYARWEQITYTVTYDAQGGTVTPGYKTVTPGGNSGNLPTPSKSGSTFQGWYTSPNGAGTKLSYNYAVNSSQTIYAYWKKNVYTVTFNADGGTVNPASKEYDYGATYGTLPTPTKATYVFGGWYTSSLGRGTKIESTSTVNGSTTLYAFWYRDVPYLKSNFTVTSGSGLYNQGGIYYYKGGGCLNYSYNYGYSAMCRNVNTDKVNNYIKVGGKTFRILQLDNQGIKIYYDGSNNIRYAYNKTGLTYTGGDMYKYFNGSFLSSIENNLTHESSIINYNPEYIQTVDPLYNWNQNGHLYDDWSWYVEQENDYGQTYRAAVGLLTPSELCYHSSYVQTPNDDTTLGYQYSCPRREPCNENNFCGRYNWVYFNENNYRKYSKTHEYAYGAPFYTDMNNETRVAFLVARSRTDLSFDHVYIFEGDEFGYGDKKEYAYAVKPVMYLQNGIKFTGSGTYTDPYVVYDN